MKRIDEQTEQRVIKLYNLGEKVVYIAACLGISNVCVIRILRRNHISPRRRHTVRQYLSKVRAMRSKGRTARSIAEALKISVRSVYSLLAITGAEETT